MSYINQSSIAKKILKAQKLQIKISLLLNERVETEKAKLINEFQNHPVTKELEAGPTASTNIIPEGYGNLFSFLGLLAYSDPISPVLDLLEDIHLVKNPFISGEVWKYRLLVPTKDEVDAVCNTSAPLEYEPGRSWIHAVTYGLGGFSHYMYSLTVGRFKQSRSGPAIQVKNKLRASSAYLRGQRYLYGMLGDFRRKFNKYNATAA